MVKKISASIKYMNNDMDWMIVNGQRIQVADYRYTSSFPRTRDGLDRKSTRLNSSHIPLSRMPSSA